MLLSEQNKGTAESVLEGRVTGDGEDGAHNFYLFIYLWLRGALGF